MKITCTNCQKRYRVHQAQLSPGIKAAKCAKCGHLISLKRADSSPPTDKAQLITISCQSCGRNYVLRKSKIPSDAAGFRCKSCRNRVSLPQKSTWAPVHSINKEPLPAERQETSIRAGKPDFARGDIFRITCPNCGQAYKIHQDSIPSNAIALNCKKCEHKISLSPSSAIKMSHNRGPSEDQKPAEPPPKLKTVSKEIPQRIRQPRRKRWLFAAAAVVFVVGMISTIAVLNVQDDGWRSQSGTGVAENKTDSSPPLKKEPFWVETHYIEQPRLVASVDIDSIKSKIPQIIKQNLFPGHYWDFGDKPRMTLDLDTLDIPNAAVAKLEYEVISIQSPDGENLLRIDENKFNPKIRPGNVFPGNLSLEVKKGTPAEALKKAAIKFKLSLPVELKIFEMKAGAKRGTQKTADGIRIVLDRLEKDVAQISYTGEKSIHLFAYDQTGEALAFKESMGSSTSIFNRFRGEIETLKIVVADKIFECDFEVDVDLNGGKELALSRKPEIPVRKRFDPKLVPTYKNYTDQDLDNLPVVWKEADESFWSDNLFIPLPIGPFSGHTRWEVHFFGKNKPQYLMGNTIQGMRDVSYRLDKGKLKTTNAAFGNVQLSIHTEITRLSFSQQDNGDPDPRTLPSGDHISVSFNKNEITYRAGKANIIQFSAYDAAGKRLKQDSYIANKDGKRAIYFWGQPVRFDIDVSTKTLRKQISFDIKKRPLDENAYQAFKQSIENQREIVAALKKVDRARRRDQSYYGDDLAGLHYIYDRKTKKPMQLIDKSIAHSDPIGQKRFNYQATPYKGYYFSVLSGTQTNGVNQDYKHQSKKTEFTWEKGSIKTFALTRHPDLVAVPKDKSQPTFFLQWGQVYMKQLYGVELNYLPENHADKGWQEVRFIGI
jgi:predicted Zn finger-like uncharacterized protein